jgi:copper chaperone CopZ
MQNQTFEVKGMRSEQCANIVAGTISAVQGVEDVNVSLLRSQAEVCFDERLVDVSTLQQALAHAGYPAIAATPRTSFCCGGCCN